MSKVPLTSFVSFLALGIDIIFDIVYFMSSPLWLILSSKDIYPFNLFYIYLIVSTDRSIPSITNPLEYKYFFYVGGSYDYCPPFFESFFPFF
jgi:hypothetical protein